jgi:hypothetical protein
MGVPSKLSVIRKVDVLERDRTTLLLVVEFSATRGHITKFKSYEGLPVGEN